MTPQPPACLSPTAWTPVADRVPATADQDRWAWRITHQERIMLDQAVVVGTALTTQRREADGTLVLLARAASHPRPPTGFPLLAWRAA